MAEMSATTRRPGLKVAVMASASAAVEWYDFFIYGTAAALIFPHLFFPADLPLFVAQIASFSTFAVGFIARPVGGMLFGHMGDTHGRKRALVAAMLIMGVSTVLIGLLPTYAQVGVWAPLMLVALRFVQGLAVGGQWGGAALLAIESAPANRRGFYGSFVQAGVPLGVVLANTVFLITSASVSDAAFMVWGWRIGFLVSVLLIVIGLLIHFKVAEPDAPRKDAPKAEVRRRSPLFQAVRSHWREILLAGGTFVANNTCFYVAITYAVAYGATSVGLDRNLLLGAVMVGSLVMVPGLMACGALSDRFGRKGIFLIGAVVSGGWAFAVFPMIDSGSPVQVVVAITVQLLFISLMYGPRRPCSPSCFPSRSAIPGLLWAIRSERSWGAGSRPSSRRPCSRAKNPACLFPSIWPPCAPCPS